MTIRDYRPDDFPQVKRLWEETGIYTVERSDTAGIILRCNQMGGKFLVMEDPDRGLVAGTSWITWDGRRLLLHHFAVAPAFQGMGHGRTLALKSLEFAKEKGSPMKLEVHQENRAAVNLYRSLGFEVFEDYDIYMILDPGAASEH
ncbi:MAG: GNAT family N-acetyltransferase [Bacteroidota bacterium]